MTLRRSTAAVAALTGTLVLASPAARAGSDPLRDWLPSALDVQPKPSPESFEPEITLPPRPEEQPSPPARASARKFCRVDLCLRLGEEAARPVTPTPLLQGVLDWSTPTGRAVPRVTLLSVSVESPGAKRR